MMKLAGLTGKATDVRFEISALFSAMVVASKWELFQKMRTADTSKPEAFFPVSWSVEELPEAFDTLRNPAAWASLEECFKDLPDDYAPVSLWLKNFQSFYVDMADAHTQVLVKSLEECVAACQTFLRSFTLASTMDEAQGAQTRAMKMTTAQQSLVAFLDRAVSQDLNGPTIDGRTCDCPVLGTLA